MEEDFSRTNELRRDKHRKELKGLQARLKEQQLKHMTQLNIYKEDNARGKQLEVHCAATLESEKQQLRSSDHSLTVVTKPRGIVSRGLIIDHRVGHVFFFVIVVNFVNFLVWSSESLSALSSLSDS